MDSKYKQLLTKDDLSLFFNGGCHVFALALQDRFGYSLVLLRNSKHKPPQGVVHVYCRVGEFAIDAKGFVLESELLGEYGCLPCDQDFSPAIVSKTELEDFFVQLFPGGGLYADLEFMEMAGNRAKERIQFFLPHFDGSFRNELPGSPRVHKTTADEYESIFHESVSIRG